MKIATVLGTRPEIIRLSLIIRELDRFCDQHVLIHTGQNFDERLSGLFFSDLQVRKPDHVLDVKASRFGEQAGQILDRVEKVFLEEKPDRLLEGIRTPLSRRSLPSGLGSPRFTWKPAIDATTTGCRKK